MRNPDCRSYGRCLARHARANSDFDCVICPRYRPEPYYPTVADISGALALLVALECPEQYRNMACRPDFKIQLLRAMVAVLHENG